MEDWKFPLIVAVAVLLAFATFPVACTLQERSRNNAVVDMVRAGADPLAAKCATATVTPTPDAVCVLAAARLTPQGEQMSFLKSFASGAGFGALVVAGSAALGGLLAALIAGIGAAVQLGRLVVYMVASVPLFYVWNELAPVYFYALPKVYLSLPYWHIVGFLWLIGVLSRALVPKFSSTVTQNNGKGE